MVVIAWQHDTISELAHRLGATNVPKQWGGKIFDRFWIIDFKNGQAINFRERPQKLLKSDSKN